MTNTGTWITTTVEDIASPERNALVGGPFGSNLVSKDYEPEGVPVIRGQNMGNGRWVSGDFAYVSDAKAQELSANTARPWDIVFTQRGTLGQVAVVPEDSFDRYIVSQSQMKLTVDCEKANPLFIYYLFSSPAMQQYMITNAIQTGVPHTNLGILRNTPIRIPARIEEQRAIARILGTLDDKMELNRQMNRTLDEIARTLFTSWFVNFDPVRAKAEGRQPDGMDAETAALFPDRFVDSEFGPIPEGWDVEALGDIANFNRSTVKPFDSPDTTFAHYSLPAFDSGQTPILIAGAAIKSAKTRIPKGAVLLSKLNPHIERVWLPSVRAEHEVEPIASTEFFVLTAREGVPRSFIMALVSSSSFQQRFAALASGTSNSHQRVRPDDAKQSACAIPDASVLAAFAEQVDPLYQATLANRAESLTLAELRDTLLPELLSGRVRSTEPRQVLREAPDCERELQSIK